MHIHLQRSASAMESGVCVYHHMLIMSLYTVLLSFFMYTFMNVHTRVKPFSGAGRAEHKSKLIGGGPIQKQSRTIIWRSISAWLGGSPLQQGYSAHRGLVLCPMCGRT